MNLQKSREPKKLWRVSGTLILLSSLTFIWMANEIGLVSFTSASANESEASEKTEQSPGLESLSQTLSERSKQLDEKETDLKRREQKVGDKEVFFSQQVQKYEKSIQELREKIVKLEQLQVARVNEFREVYEKMDPKKSSAILNELDTELSSAIVKSLSQAKAAEVLAKMQVDKAKRITEKLARTPAGIEFSPTQVNGKDVSDAKSEANQKPKGGE